MVLQVKSKCKENRIGCSYVFSNFPVFLYGKKEVKEGAICTTENHQHRRNLLQFFKQ